MTLAAGTLAEGAPGGPGRRRFRLRLPGAGTAGLLRGAALAVAALAMAPLAAIVWLAISQPEAAAMPGPLVARYARDTALLAVLVGAGASALGATTAWLVVMRRFPGRGFFEWALVMPLAAPAFALAYAYADLLDVAGPVRSWLRLEFGWTWFPFEIRSLPGAAFILSCAFYPYVYLTCRAAFTSQSICALEAARTLGASPWETWRRVALPLARPAIAAGAALAIMETLADYGAVQFLGVQTLTTGVVRAWSAYGAPGAAARLSLMLMGAAIVLLWMERLGRRGRSYAGGSVRWRALEPKPLSKGAGIAATAYCAVLLGAALLLPAAWLVIKAMATTPDFARFARASTHSMSLAVAGALVTVALAAVLAFAARYASLAPRLVSLGYATPGAVMAIGLLAPAGVVWRTVPGATSSLAVGATLLIYAYAARLIAAALEPLDAGLARVTPSMERAARTLGETEPGALRRVHAPLASGAVLTALLLVFVDILKELPATVILRPFNLDTLAVMAHAYAADERIAQAAWPALMLVVLAAGPVALISRRIARSRPGEGG